MRCGLAQVYSATGSNPGMRRSSGDLLASMASRMARASGEGVSVPARPWRHQLQPPWPPFWPCGAAALSAASGAPLSHGIFAGQMSLTPPWPARAYVLLSGKEVIFLDVSHFSCRRTHL